MVKQHAIDERTLLKVVAAEARVSEAMVVKLAKKLSFDGFRSLRAALAEHNRLPLAEIRQELSLSGFRESLGGDAFNPIF
jgi:DNA-binding MurR/RpiR family transcriptional regulator